MNSKKLGSPGTASEFLMTKRQLDLSEVGIEESGNKADNSGNTPKSTTSASPKSKAKDFRLRNILSKDGGKMEELFMKSTVSHTTSYQCEQWIRKIYQMDNAGAIRQLKDMGVLEVSEGFWLKNMGFRMRVFVGTQYYCSSSIIYLKSNVFSYYSEGE